MLCSSCLVGMQRRKGIPTCPRCGRTGTIRFEDGTEADVRPIRRAGPRPAWGFMGLLLLLPALAGAAWWLRADIAGLLAGAERPAARLMSTQPAAPPTARPQASAGFGALGEQLIGVWGTPRADRLRAFAVLNDASFAALLETPRAEGAARDGSGSDLWLVQMDGSGALRTRAVPLEAPLRGAALAPAGTSGFVLALAHEAGGFVAGWAAGAEPAWRQDLAAAPGPAPIVVAGPGLTYLAAPAGREGMLNVSALDEAGQLVWQRAFEAKGAVSVQAGLTGDKGLFLAIDTPLSADIHDVRLLTVSALGEVEDDTRLMAPGAVEAFSSADGGADLVVSAMPPVLIRTGPGGERRTLLAAGALHDSLHLARGPLGPAIVSAHAVSDTRTELQLLRPEGGLAAARLELPASTRLTHVSAAGGGSLLLAGETGEGEGSEIFVMIIPANEQGALAASSPTPSASGPPEGPSCRFACLADGETLWLLRELAGPIPEDLSALSDLHEAACDRIGAETVLTAPRCLP